MDAGSLTASGLMDAYHVRVSRLIENLDRIQADVEEPAGSRAFVRVKKQGWARVPTDRQT